MIKCITTIYNIFGTFHSNNNNIKASLNTNFVGGYQHLKKDVAEIV